MDDDNSLSGSEDHHGGEGGNGKQSGKNHVDSDINAQMRTSFLENHLLWIGRAILKCVKNKKASKLAAQAEASGSANGSAGSGAATAASITSPRSPAMNVGLSDTASKSTPATSAAPSGLSNMLSKGGASTGNTQENESRTRLPFDPVESAYRASQSDNDGVAIGMSPMGLPLPADLTALPGAASTARPGSSLASGLSTQRAKPFSYASAVAAPGASSSGSGSVSPTSTKAQPSTARTATQQSQPSDVPHSQAPHSVSGLVSAASTLNTARIPPNLSPTMSSQFARLSSSVPAEQTLPGFSSTRSGQYTDSFAHGQPHKPSMLHNQLSTRSHNIPPPLQHSHSHAASTQGLYGLKNGIATPSMPMSAGISSNGQRTPSSAAVFGTSPFGNNAIFLASSFDDDKDAYISRSLSRAPGAERDRSPKRHERSGTITAPRRLNGTAIGSDFGGVGDDEDDVVEEELVPSSLKHLLTPDEKARRDSRSGISGKSSDFWNPFDDTAGDVIEADAQRYSRSVPAQSAYFASSQTYTTVNPPAPFSRAPGTSPVLSTHSSKGDHSRPRTLLNAGSINSHHTPQPTYVERGFYSSSYMPPAPAGANTLAARPSHDSYGLHGTPPVASPSNLASLSAIAGTSLPQGLAAGLSRLHLIPAGTQHTGYTPSGSYVGSPPVSVSPPSNASLLSPTAFRTTHTSSPSGTTSQRLPSASYNTFANSSSSATGMHTTQGVGAAKSIQFGNFHGHHVGSPLARSEFPVHISAGPPASAHLQQHGHFAHQHQGNRAASHTSNDEDELVFDMDV
ncbi:hypothetical protein EMMF5_002597 [Cystobasidiomycetes sp. EMM_F5]